MVINIDRCDADKVLKFLKEEDIAFESASSSFDMFLKHEIEQCEDVYSEVLGRDTLDLIAEKVSDELSNSEVDFVSTVYFENVLEVCKIIDTPTTAVCTITNNLSIELKDLVDDEFVCVVGNEVYRGETVIDGFDNECIKIGEMLIPLSDFVSVI